MKIRINNEIAVTPVIAQTSTCPAGAAYWDVSYKFDGFVVHTANTGAICGEPNVIEMLDQCYTHHLYLPEDALAPDGYTRKGSTGINEVRWSRNLTHRQAIIEAVAKLVKD